MENILDRIAINPDICNGKPIIKGTRITVQTILDYLSAGEKEKEILRQYPFLKSEDIMASIKFEKFSPLDVKGINLDLTKDDIIDIIRESRERN